MNDGAMRIAVVGQVPPPTGGQALMTRILLDGTYEDVELFHVPMRFSDSLGEMGRVRVRKLLELVAVAWRIAKLCLRERPEVLYYVPAPPATVPVLRDIAVLNVVRSWFRHTVFHFHAGGVAEFESSMPRGLRPLFRRAYRHPDVAILTSRGAPDDGAALSAHATYVVPNGIPDPRELMTADRSPTSDVLRVLYVGLVSREKGVDTFLEACRHLQSTGMRFRVDLVGPFADRGIEQQVRAAARTGPLSGILEVHGPVEGPEKWEFFRVASILCFPSHHPSETFGLVMIEALAAGLPVVASRRRGAPEIIDDGVTGRLFEPGDAADLCTCLCELLGDPERLEELGRRAREQYERSFTDIHFRSAMQRIFDSLAGSDPGGTDR